MKKSVALLLVIVSLFTLFSLTACKKQEKKDDNPPKLPQGTVVIKTVSENAMLRYLAIYQQNMQMYHISTRPKKQANRYIYR